MQVVKLKKYQIRVPKNNSAFRIDTPDSEIRLHQMLCCVNKRGGAKTTTIVSKLKDFAEAGVADRIFLVSPTIQSNMPLFSMLMKKHGDAKYPAMREEDMYSKTTRESLAEIVEKIEEEGDAWKKYEEDVKKYARLQKMIAKGKTPLMEMNSFWQMSGINDDFAPPESRYGHKPTLHLLLDDTQGTDVMSVSKNSCFLNLCLRHRHVGKSLGVSIYILLQTYIGQGASCPRIIRENCTTLMIGKTKDRNTIEKIISEICSDIDEADFRKAYEYAISFPFSFLTVDFHPKHPSARFRRNFEELIVFPEKKEDF